MNKTWLAIVNGNNDKRQACKNSSYVIVVYEYKQEFIILYIYTETECPPLHMLCTNTLRKVMAQLPLTTKDVNNIEAMKCTYFLQK